MSERRLGDIADVVTGPFGSALHQNEYVPNGIPVIMPQDIGNRVLMYEKIAFIPPEKADELSRYTVCKNDIVYARRGDIEKHAFIAEKDAGAICGTGCLRVRLKTNKVDPAYLSFFLNKPETKKWIVSHAVGSNMLNINSEILADVPLNLPDYAVQKSISAVLCDIEEKIVNNTAICSELESMAKFLYDYWFVQFDFPDENGRPYKSSGGKMVWNEELKREIPEGWEVDRLGAKCQCLLGGTPSREKPEYWGGSINWINSGAVNDFRISSPSETITDEGLRNTSTYLLPRNTTVLAITGATLGQVSILNIDACANQSVVGVLETGEVPTEYIYPSIVSSMKALLNQQTGAAQPHVNKQDITEMIFAFPPRGIMVAYMSAVKSLYESIMEKSVENQQLASLRDFLLPMLMNGQVKVGKAGE